MIQFTQVIATGNNDFTELDIVSPRSSSNSNTADAQDSDMALEPSRELSSSPSFCFDRQRLPETFPMLDKVDITEPCVLANNSFSFEGEEFIQTSPVLSVQNDDEFKQDFKALTSGFTSPQTQTAESFTSSLFTFKDDIIINPSLTTQLQRINDKYQNEIEAGLMHYALITESFTNISDIGRITQLIMEHVGDAIASYCCKMDFIKTHAKPKIDDNNFINEYYFKKLNARQSAIDKSLKRAKNLLVQYDLDWRHYSIDFFGQYTSTIAEFVKKDQVNSASNTTVVAGQSNLR